MAISTATAISTAISVAVSVASAITSGVIGYQQNKAQAKNAEALAEQERANAKRAELAAEQQAKQIEQKQAAEERIQRERNRSLLAQNRARIGAGGLDYSGTPLLVEIGNAMDMELDLQNSRIDAQNEMQNVRYQGSLLSISHENQARGYDYQSKQYRKAATASVWSAALTSVGQIGSAAAGAAGKAYGKWAGDPGWEKVSSGSAAGGTGSGMLIGSENSRGMLKDSVSFGVGGNRAYGVDL